MHIIASHFAASTSPITGICHDATHVAQLCMTAVLYALWTEAALSSCSRHA